MNPQKRERLTVEQNGEEKTVYNWANIMQPAVVRGHNPVVEKFDPDIGAGDSPEKPDAITHWLAEELWHEFGIEAEDHGIEVVNVESDEATVL